MICGCRVLDRSCVVWVSLICVERNKKNAMNVKIFVKNVERIPVSVNLASV